MTITKELKWKDLTTEEQELAVSCGKLTNPKDFLYHRVLGQLHACDDETAYQATVPAEYAEEYPDEYFGFDNDEDAYVTGAYLHPLRTDEELDEETVCKNYLGVDPAQVSDFTIC